MLFMLASLCGRLMRYQTFLSFYGHVTSTSPCSAKLHSSFCMSYYIASCDWMCMLETHCLSAPSCAPASVWYIRRSHYSTRLSIYVGELPTWLKAIWGRILQNLQYYLNMIFTFLSVIIYGFFKYFALFPAPTPFQVPTTPFMVGSVGDVYTMALLLLQAHFNGIPCFMHTGLWRNNHFPCWFCDASLHAAAAITLSWSHTLICCVTVRYTPHLVLLRRFCVS